MRRPNDAYYTPEFVTKELIRQYPHLLKVQICEPCAGDGAMAKLFPKCWAYDIDPALGHVVADATRVTYDKRVDSFVTNPPFNQAFEILKNLRRQQKHGGLVALFVRLTFLEPTEDRGPYLAENPPDHIVVCPRISFTGDGKTDSVTCAWMIWHGQGYFLPTGISVLPKTKEPA